MQGSGETDTVGENTERIPDQTNSNQESGEITTSEAIAQAESEVNTNPSQAQKEAGNYKMGHVEVQGFDITIENPKGSVRSGMDKSGKKRETLMNNLWVH